MQLGLIVGRLYIQFRPAYQSVTQPSAWRCCRIHADLYIAVQRSYPDTDKASFQNSIPLH